MKINHVIGFRNLNDINSNFMYRFPLVDGKVLNIIKTCNFSQNMKNLYNFIIFESTLIKKTFMYLC